MSLNKVWLSFIDYRPDPSVPEQDKLVLGCILQAQLGNHQEYSLAAREELTETERAWLDGIGREVLARPAEFLEREFKRILEGSLGTLPREEGGGLRALSREFPWSLHVTAPRAIRIERLLSQTNSQALRTATEDLMIARILNRDVSLTRPLRARRIIPDDWKEQVPPERRISYSSLASAA